MGSMNEVVPSFGRPPLARGNDSLRPGVSSRVYQEIKSALHRDMLAKIDLEKLRNLQDLRARQQILAVIQDLMTQLDTPLSMVEKDRLCREVLDEVFGLGPLEPLLQDPTINDILVNTHNAVYVERAGVLEKTGVTFKDQVHLMHIIDKIVSAVGRRVDESSPMVDARLADGSRVNVIIPPLAVDGPIVSIRRFGTVPLEAADLLRNVTITPEMLQLLQGAIKARLNIVVSGGTGAGKTTLLNVLSTFIPDSERIVTIEDSAELQLKQHHVVRLECRPANLEGRGGIKQRELVVNSLRMRPDRIIVGEVRSEEALDMLQAMNTGHDGSLTTLHANTPRDGLGRLEVMVGMANSNMGIRSIRQQIASAVDLFIQTSRFSDGTRRITHITEVVGMEQDVITLQDVFLFEKTGTSESGRVTGRFRATGIRPKFYERLKTSGITLPTQLFQTVVEIN